jgi:hypothetical protein
MLHKNYSLIHFSNHFPFNFSLYYLIHFMPSKKLYPYLILSAFLVLFIIFLFLFEFSLFPIFLVSNDFIPSFLNFFLLPPCLTLLFFLSILLIFTIITSFPPLLFPFLSNISYYFLLPSHQHFLFLLHHFFV